MTHNKKVIVIGAGISGLSISALLAKQGFDVTVVEKNSIYGGRGRVFKSNGFKFDMGPSWYLLPKVFEEYFKMFDEDISEYLDLVKLNPSYRIFLPNNLKVDISPNIDENIKIFEKIEPGVSNNFKKYLKKSEDLYKLLVEEMFFEDFTSKKTFLSTEKMKKFKSFSPSDLLGNYEKLCNRYFKNEDLKRIIQYGVALLGSHPEEAPALYAMMSYADYVEGVYYPMGGLNKLFAAIYKLGRKHGVRYKFNFDVNKIEVQNRSATSVSSKDNQSLNADIVISTGDYHHTETEYLDNKYRTYSDGYWEKRKIGASAFIIYLGLKKKLPNLLHHNLFLDRDWKAHFGQLLNSKEWPKRPAYYVCSPSITDESVAPAGCENLFFTVPIPAGAKDTPEIRRNYFDKIIKHFETVIGEEIKYDIIYKRIFTIKDFENDYHAYKGTALGLANTLSQTGIFRVKYKSSKVKNLYYSGQYTHPGSGLSSCIASSKIVSDKIIKEYL